jgi:hypothetical protein
MTQRDPNLDHVAVKEYREICHLTPNWFQRKEIVTTFDWAKKQFMRGVSPTVFVSEEQKTARALTVWKAVLEKFMLEGCNPKRVDWAMDRFEQRIRSIAGIK